MSEGVPFTQLPPYQDVFSHTGEKVGKGEGIIHPPLESRGFLAPIL
jgi:hypothetical protein